MDARAKAKPRSAPRKQRRSEDDDAARQYSIGDLAKEFGVSTRTIRFYEDKGLIGPEREGANRIYSRRDRARLVLILRGKRLGFSLGLIAKYLDLYDADPGQIAQTTMLLERVEAAISALRTKRDDIDKTLAELAGIAKGCRARLKRPE